MAGSGDEPNKGIDATAGGLVWVHRRNGSWWPGKILSPDELPEDCNPTPRAGTPIQLLGKDDASVDWYNLEKSKRVKAFHCKEYDECIKKVQASASHPSKRAAKYARREDAILQALELENARVGKDHPNLSATLDAQEANHVAESPSALENYEDENLNSFGDDSDPGPELSQSGVSFDGQDHVGSVNEESKQWETENDSEDDASEGVKRMRGVEDLGMGVASPQKRKQTQVGHLCEISKRKNRRRPLTKVMECATMVIVPVICERLSIPNGNCAVDINKSSDSNEAPSHYSMRLFDVPVVAEQNNSAGLSSIVFDAPKQTHAGGGAHSSQSGHVESTSLGNEESESGLTHLGTLGWQLKGKRNSRSRRAYVEKPGSSGKTGPQDLGPTLVSDNGGCCVKSKPFRQSRRMVNPKYDDSSYSLAHRIAVSGLSGLYDVNIEVKSSYQPQHVPYISLMSRLTGWPIVGHPIEVDVFEDGSCDCIISDSEFDPNGDVFDLGSDGRRRGRGWPPSKHGLPLRSPKSRIGISPKKTRKLSSLTGSRRLSREETKPVVEKLEGPSIPCVPLKVVFSRINAALTSSARAGPA